MAGITLPPLEYCTLKRAAEILECATSDLLNWAVTGRIEVCVYLDNADADIWLTGHLNNNPEVFDYLRKAYGYIAPNSHINVQESRGAKDFNNQSIKTYQMRKLRASAIPLDPRYIRAYLSGLWSIYIIPPTLETRGYIDIPEYNPKNIQTFSIRPADVAHFFITPFQLRNDTPLKLTVDDLFITRTQIENLLRDSSFTDEHSAEQTPPIFHLVNNRYSFFSTENNYSLSNQTVQFNNIHNEIHNNNMETPQPVQPKNKNPKRTEFNATKREQFLQAAIYVAFTPLYKNKFKLCYTDEIVDTTEWANLIIDNAKDLLLTKRGIKQSKTSIKMLLDDCLQDINKRTQVQNKEFRLKQKSNEPLI